MFCLVKLFDSVDIVLLLCLLRGEPGEGEGSLIDLWCISNLPLYLLEIRNRFPSSTFNYAILQNSISFFTLLSISVLNLFFFFPALYWPTLHWSLSMSYCNLLLTFLFFIPICFRILFFSPLLSPDTSISVVHCRFFPLSS